MHRPLVRPATPSHMFPSETTPPLSPEREEEGGEDPVELLQGRKWRWIRELEPTGSRADVRTAMLEALSHLDQTYLKQVERLQSKLGYTFSDEGRLLLVQALTHSSYRHENRLLECNERLEFLGDAVIQLNVSEQIFKQYPQMQEGFMTKMRSGLVDQKALASVARELALGGYILLGSGEENTGGRNKCRILACCVEAIVAAIYLDGGIIASREFFYKFIHPRFGSVSFNENYKSNLQEIVLKNSGDLPKYIDMSEEGPDHQKMFTCQVEVYGMLLGTGTAASKKGAQQKAAKEAIRKLHTDHNYLLESAGKGQKRVREDEPLPL